RAGAAEQGGEGLQLRLGAGGLAFDEAADAVEAAQRVVEAHDLERAPAGRLQRRGGVQLRGAVQAFPFAGRRARVAARVPARVAEVGMAAAEASGGEAVEHVALE